MNVRTGLAAAAALLLGAAAASAQAFNQAVIFGDSTVDSGFYKALPNPGGGAQFNTDWPIGVAHGAGAPTTSPGLMNSQVLASYFGLSALPANQPGGTNYATSGAKNQTVNSQATGGFGKAIPTDVQIQTYLAANNGVANGNALYLISSGGNDVSVALGQTGTDLPGEPQRYTSSARRTISAPRSRSLRAAGARYFVVPDLPYSFAMNNDRQARLLYSQTLWSSLAAAGINFIPADFNAVRLAMPQIRRASGFIDQQCARQHRLYARRRHHDGVGLAVLIRSCRPVAFRNAERRSVLFVRGRSAPDVRRPEDPGGLHYSLIVAPSKISIWPRRRSRPGPP